MSQQTATAEDVNARIARIIEEWVPEEGDLVPAVAAAKLVAQLNEVEPELLADWLFENAERFLAGELRHRLRTHRGESHARSKPRAFHAAVEAAAIGDVGPLSGFAEVFTVDEDGTQRYLADMNGDDHTFVAESFQQSGQHALLRAACHRAIAKLVGRRRTADVMTEEQYAALCERLMRGVRA